jgi:NAD-dependent deacetylase
MKRIVVLTGAGISAESGISTFRDANGLWENHDVMEVASPEGWRKNPELVLRFYNERRRQMNSVSPNEGHYALVALEEKYDVQIITQNVDNLHERAGSSNILHLHGQLNKARSVKNKTNTFPCEGDINLGDLAEDGGQIRPHIVWFGEDVPEILNAVSITKTADILLIIGTSMKVYPAAALIDYVSERVPIFVIDPNIPEISPRSNVSFIPKKGTEGIPEVVKMLLELEKNNG